MNVSVAQSHEEHIAVPSTVLIAPIAAQNHVWIHAQKPRCYCGRSAVIALCASNCDDGFTLAAQRVGEKKLQFSYFVTTQVHTRPVFALNVHLCALGCARYEPPMDWCRKLAQSEPKFRHALQTAGPRRSLVRLGQELSRRS